MNQNSYFYLYLQSVAKFQDILIINSVYWHFIRNYIFYLYLFSFSLFIVLYKKKTFCDGRIWHFFLQLNYKTFKLK